MRSLLRPATLFLLLTYALLTAVPFVPALLGRALEHPWQMLTFELLAWLAVWSVFKRPAYFHWLLVPAFLALPTEIYLFIFYGQGISTHHLGIIFETSPKEAMEFLGQKVWLMGAVMLGVIAWCALGWYAATRTRDLDWRGKTRPAAFVLLLLLGGFWWYGYEFGFEAKVLHGAPASAKASGPSASGKAGASGFGDASSAEDETPRKTRKAASRRTPASPAPTKRAWAGPACPTGRACPTPSTPSAIPGPSAWPRVASISTRNASTWPSWDRKAAASVSARTSNSPMPIRKWWSW